MPVLSFIDGSVVREMGAPDILNRYPVANSLVEEASSGAVGGNRVHDRDVRAPQTDEIKESGYGRSELMADTTIVVLAMAAIVAAVVFLVVLFYG
ncbi:MAG: hypothetical protein MUE55_01690 [Thermoplasmata archaeon]|jgi:hypothetical protein|nr:hypothetical protein [Thermoplasmata archaeon]